MPRLHEDSRSAGRDNLDQASLKRLMFRYRCDVFSTNENSTGLSLINRKFGQFNSSVVNDNGHLFAPSECETTGYNPYNPEHAEHAGDETADAANVYPRSDAEIANDTTP